MRPEFDQQLDQLHRLLSQMGNLCQQAISLSALALREGTKAQIQKVGSLEYEIDRLERDTETICMRLLLRQQPVAADLRTISAALKMISDMERIGDQAADIAELIPYIAPSSLGTKVRIRDMADATVQMVSDSVRAFVLSDLELASQVVKADDQVDALFEQVKEELMALIPQHSIDAKSALDLLMTAKYFERIGDHAVNIAEWVEFSITGVHRSEEHHAISSL